MRRPHPVGIPGARLPIFNTLSDVFYLLLIAVIAALATANISSSRYMIIGLALMLTLKKETGPPPADAGDAPHR